MTKNRSVGKVLTTTNSTVYTVPPQFKTEVNSIVISNALAVKVSFSLDWYDSASSTYFTLAESVVLLPNSMLHIDYPLYLQQNDTLRGLASAVDAVTVSVKVSEQYTLSNL